MMTFMTECFFVLKFKYNMLTYSKGHVKKITSFFSTFGPVTCPWSKLFNYILNLKTKSGHVTGRKVCNLFIDLGFTWNKFVNTWMYTILYLRKDRLEQSWKKYLFPRMEVTYSNLLYIFLCTKILNLLWLTKFPRQQQAFIFV